MRKYLIDKPVKWYKGNKLMIGIIIVITSFILGFLGKAIIIAKLYKPVELLTGISIYAFSFVLLFTGAFLVGWETVKMAQYRIRHHVKETVKGTYHYTKGLPKKSIDKLASTSKIIAEKIRKK